MNLFTGLLLTCEEESVGGVHLDPGAEVALAVGQPGAHTRHHHRKLRLYIKKVSIDVLYMCKCSSILAKKMLSANIASKIYEKTFKNKNFALLFFPFFYYNIYDHLVITTVYLTINDAVYVHMLTVLAQPD